MKRTMSNTPSALLRFLRRLSSTKAFARFAYHNSPKAIAFRHKAGEADLPPKKPSDMFADGHWHGFGYITNSPCLNDDGDALMKKAKT